MANYTGGTLAICPFYKREAEKSIACEGFTTKTEIKVCFRSANHKGQWLKQRCFRQDYAQACPLAAVLVRKHEKDTT